MPIHGMGGCAADGWAGGVDKALQVQSASGVVFVWDLPGAERQAAMNFGSGESNRKEETSVVKKSGAMSELKTSLPEVTQRKRKERKCPV